MSEPPITSPRILRILTIRSVSSLSFFFSFCGVHAGKFGLQALDAYFVELWPLGHICNDFVDLRLVYSKPRNVLLSVYWPHPHNTDPALPDDGPARRRTRLAVSCDCGESSWWFGSAGIYEKPFQNLCPQWIVDVVSLDVDGTLVSQFQPRSDCANHVIAFVQSRTCHACVHMSPVYIQA